MRLAIALSIGILATTPCAAESRADGGDSRCDAVATLAIPAADVGTAAPRCDAQALYYGLEGHAIDAIAARRCALAERERRAATSAILMMIYGNGAGVARNIPLAEKFACEIHGASTELWKSLDLLDELGDGSFDVCDAASSGALEALCAERQARVSRFEREAWIENLARPWSAEERAALTALRAAATRYFESSARREADPSRAALATNARDALEAGFASRLERADAIEAADARDLAEADAELNAAYRKALVHGPGVREAERAWIAYRDAWVEFGRRKYPSLAATAWQTELTRERTAQLLASIGE